MRDEHGMLREVYIYCHDFCHTFRWYEMRDEHGMLREVYDERTNEDAIGALCHFVLPQYGAPQHTRTTLYVALRP